MRVLVTGGAGYIGSHTVRLLEQRGHDVSVLDDLSTGHLGAAAQTPLLEADLVTDRLEPILAEVAPDAVIHFAGKALVPESVRDPARYWQTNVVGGLRLLEAMRRTGVRRMVFSSTCAVYGIPERSPIDEATPLRPITPYGRSKLAFENVLSDFCSAYQMAGAALRYFNAAGADEGGCHGEDHDPETHLIPLLLRAIRDGGTFKLFGTDYPTPDGSCVRDYIHLDDLALAHALALEALEPGRFDAVNLGTGRGHSVREVVAAAERITGRKVQLEEAPRREGDPPALVASVDRASRRLGFRAQRTLDDILRSAWAWHSRKPRGYGAVVEEGQTMRFGELAVRLGLVSDTAIVSALDEQRARVERGQSHKLLGLVLLEMGAIDNAQLIQILRAYQDLARGLPLSSAAAD